MDTAELKRLLAESSQGKWVAVETGSEKYMAWIGIGTAKDHDTVALVDNRKIEIGTVDVDEANANANLIVALRNNAEELIASAERVKELEIEVGRWKAEARVNDAKFHGATGACAHFVAERDAKAERVKELEAALNKIASWEEGEILDSSFDDPFSAEIARQALGSGK